MMFHLQAKAKVGCPARKSARIQGKGKAAYTAKPREPYNTRTRGALSVKLNQLKGKTSHPCAQQGGQPCCQAYVKQASPVDIEYDKSDKIARNIERNSACVRRISARNEEKALCNIIGSASQQAEEHKEANCTAAQQILKGQTFLLTGSKDGLAEKLKSFGATITSDLPQYKVPCLFYLWA